MLRLIMLFLPLLQQLVLDGELTHLVFQVTTLYNLGTVRVLQNGIDALAKQHLQLVL